MESYHPTATDARGAAVADAYDQEVHVVQDVYGNTAFVLDTNPGACPRQVPPS